MVQELEAEMADQVETVDQDVQEAQLELEVLLEPDLEALHLEMSEPMDLQA